MPVVEFLFALSNLGKFNKYLSDTFYGGISNISLKYHSYMRPVMRNQAFIYAATQADQHLCHSIIIINIQL